MGKRLPPERLSAQIGGVASVGLLVKGITIEVRRSER